MNYLLNINSNIIKHYDIIVNLYLCSFGVIEFSCPETV
jgi:hypothetical protein